MTAFDRSSSVPREHMKRQKATSNVFVLCAYVICYSYTLCCAEAVMATYIWCICK